MNLEIRYTVLKHTDLSRHLSATQRKQLAAICQAVAEGRKEDGKDEFGCLVIEKDWPEYEPTFRMLSQRVDQKEKQ